MPTATAIAVTCDEGQQAVAALHPVFWRVFDGLVQGLQFSCGPQQRDGDSANQVVMVEWSYKGTERTAEYLVGPTGAVAPDDANATRLDEAAKYSPLLLKTLLGGL